MGGFNFTNPTAIGLMLIVMMSVCHGDVDKTGGCTKPQPTPSKAVTKPSLPKSYEFHVECIIMDKQQSTEIHEFFDFNGNRGVIRQRQMRQSLWFYYDYDSTEFIKVSQTDNACVVHDLSRTSERFLFGYTPSGNDTGHIFSAAGSLRFASDTIKEIYIGTDVVRGIQTRKWYSCQYWKPLSASMDVWWHFSNPNSWDTALGLPEIPIRAHVIGVVYDGQLGAPRKFEHIYDFIHFKNYIEEDNVFETPSMVVCPGRKNTKTFPDLPQSFTFTTEVIDTFREAVSFMTESYDIKANATKFEYTPGQLSYSPYGYRPLTEIHDFNTGLAYIIDNLHGNCSTVPIEQHVHDVKTIDAHHVRMQTAMEFFSKDNTVATYEGIKSARNIPCDTWVGQRTTAPPGIVSGKVNSTWEWYFKTNSWTSVQHTDEVSAPSGTPIQMRTNIPAYGMTYIYNIFGYSSQQQNLMIFDISSCYANESRKRFDFQISSSYKNSVAQNRKVFLYSTLISLSRVMNVSPLRISNINLIYQDNIHIRFELLDVAPSIGDVQNPKTETSLETATTALTTAVNSNGFVILLISENENKVIPITVKSGSIIEYSYGSKFTDKTDSVGYSPGSMAGLAVGMIVTGGGAGALLAFKLFK